VRATPTRTAGFYEPAEPGDAERFEPLAEGLDVRIERIVSPPGFRGAPDSWYDQELDEWVLLASGWARLEIEGSAAIELVAGDSLHLPARCRHRVAETAADRSTIWLAVHYRAAGSGRPQGGGR